MGNVWKEFLSKLTKTSSCCGLRVIAVYHSGIDHPLVVTVKLKEAQGSPKKMQLSVGLKQVGNLSWDNTSVVAVQVGGIKFEESGPEIASTMNDHNSHHPGETVL